MAENDLNSSRARSRLAGATLAASTSFSCLSLVLGLIATPLLLALLDDARVGAFRALCGWTGYLALFDLGLAGAVNARASRAAASGDTALGVVVAAGAVAYRRVAVSVALGAVAITVVIPWLIHAPGELAIEVRVAAAIGALSAALWPLAVVRPALEALQRGYLVNCALIVQSLIVTLGGVLLAWLGWGVPGLAAATLAGLAVFSWLQYRALRSVSPAAARAVFARRATVEKSVRDDLRSLQWPTLLSRLSGQVALLSDNLIIAWFLGPAAVVPFFVTRRLPDIATGQVQSLGGAGWAGLAEIHYQGQHELFRERALEMTRLTVVGAVALLGPIWIYNREFVGLWVGGDRFAGDAITSLAVANGLLLSVLSLWGWLFGGTGKVGLIAPVGAAATVVNVVISLFVTWQYGWIGPLVGTFAGFTLVSAWATPLLLRREFGIRLRSLAAATVTPLLAAAPPTVLTAIVVARLQHEPNWLLLLAEMASLVIVTLVWSYLLVLSPGERSLWRERLRPLIRRGRD